GDEDVFMPFRLPPGEVHVNSGRPRARWHFALGDYVGQPYTPRDEAEWIGFVGDESGGGRNDDMSRIDNEVFLDPTHRVEDFLAENGEIKALRNGSYGYNYHYLGNTRAEAPDGGPANFPVRGSRIEQPGLTVAIADSNGNQYLRRDRGFHEHAYTLDPPRLDRRLHEATGFAQEEQKSPAEARHGGRATVAWVDGHGATRSLEELGYPVVDATFNIVADDAGSNALWNGLGYDEDETE
ncbi:MAG: hypothetical protein CMJ31_13500, partial [Phycisphaerae bacterium]|nr:hypothetical protein [Phycisphaerae bacterium]